MNGARNNYDIYIYIYMYIYIYIYMNRGWIRQESHEYIFVGIKIYDTFITKIFSYIF